MVQVHPCQPFTKTKTMTDLFDKFKCQDCEVNTGEIHEYYMLLDDLWMQIRDKYHGMLCIGCVEKKLGRKLNKQDFVDVPINNIDERIKSERLVNRLTVE